MSDPISVVSLLCEAMAEQGKDVKAQVNHQDNFGQTPLHRAALRGATICALNLLQVVKVRLSDVKVTSKLRSQKSTKDVTISAAKPRKTNAAFTPIKHV